MSPLYTRTPNDPYQAAFATAISAAVAANPAPTITEPTGVGVIPLPRDGNLVPNFGSLVFFGTGTAGNTGVAHIFLWHKVGNLWFPTMVLDLTVTLGAAVGVAGQTVLDTHKFAKTLVAATPTSENSIDVYSPATTSGIGKVDFDLHGSSKVQVILGVTTVTDLNALFTSY